MSAGNLAGRAPKKGGAALPRRDLPYQPLRLRLRDCEWEFLEHEFPSRLDMNVSASEMKEFYGIAAFLYGLGIDPAESFVPRSRQSNFASLFREASGHDDWARLCTEFLFIAASRDAASASGRRTDCAVCRRLPPRARKAGEPACADGGARPLQMVATVEGAGRGSLASR